MKTKKLFYCLALVPILCALFVGLSSCTTTPPAETTASASSTSPAVTTAPLTTLLRDFETATPEEVGLSSANIEALVRDLMEDKGHALHSMIIVRGGKLVAEAYVAPFEADTLQRMYSSSKSITSLSIGLLASTGAISLDDPILKYFPEYDETSPNYNGTVVPEEVKRAKIVDLLKMDSPYPTDSYTITKDSWLHTFFDPSDKLQYSWFSIKEPGSGQFAYDTSASYLLGVIVERVSGMDFLTYLRINALDQIGFSRNATCVKSPDGYAWGGSGVLCTTKDFAKIGFLTLRGGSWYGTQLLPRDYLSEATSFQIQNPTDSINNYKGHGYGYQIWLHEHGFVFTGMGDQMMIAVPELDMIFVCTADNQSSSSLGNPSSRQQIFDAVEEYLINPATDGPLPSDDEAYASMNAYFETLTLPVQKGALTGTLAFDGVTYEATVKNDNIASFRLDFESERGGVLTYTTVRDGVPLEKRIPFGIGENVFGILDEPGYSGEQMLTPNEVGYKMAASGAWTDDDTFTLFVQVIDTYLGHMQLSFELSDDGGLILTGKKNAEAFLEEYVVKGVLYQPAED